MKMRKVTQNVETEVIWGSFKVIANITIHKVNTTSYSTLIETMHLSYTIYEL